MMFCLNEADIVEETITEASKKVDQLYVADDGSSDKSWEIIQSCKNRIKNITQIQQIPNKKDPGQRQSLLNKVKKRFNPEETWVQIIEADMFLLNNPKDYLHLAVDDLALTWSTLNAVRLPGTWKGIDTYPNWTKPIREIMPYAHWMEMMLYTFRPMPKLYYTSIWRPWPRGFSKYSSKKLKLDRKEAPDSPILLHCGYRGPTHFYHKYKKMGKRHKKYPNWDLSSLESIERTVPFFGEWAEKSFEWQKRIKQPQ